MGEHSMDPLVADDDTLLLAYGRQVDALMAEIAAIQLKHDARRERRDGADDDSEAELIRLIEARFCRLEPIAQEIATTPARSIAGLGVKARLVAHAVSSYWDVSPDRLDCDARLVRLLIEAVCSLARVPLPFDDTARG